MVSRQCQKNNTNIILQNIMIEELNRVIMVKVLRNEVRNILRGSRAFEVKI